MANNTGKTPPPTVREYSMAQLVNEAEKEERHKPDVVYVFSGGATKTSTDATDSGIYKR